MPYTGFESFDVPFDWKQPKTSGGTSGGFEAGEVESGSSSGGGSADDQARRAAEDLLDAAENRKKLSLLQIGLSDKDIRQSYKTAIKQYRQMVNQAKYFLPRTLDQLGSQFASQGSYYSSGRRGAQEEAAKKTHFDLAENRLALGEQARKARFELAKNILARIEAELAEEEAEDQASRMMEAG